jgi:HK97 gp10 family phage protein
MDINITGLEELESILLAMPAKVISINNESLLESAELIKSRAEPLAPQAKNHSKSGPQHKGSKRDTPPEHLADSIPISKIKKPNSLRASIDVGWKLSDNSPYFYAKFVEFGTSKMPPRPFLQDALNSSEDEIVSIFKSKIETLGLGD